MSYLRFQIKMVTLAVCVAGIISGLFIVSLCGCLCDCLYIYLLGYFLRSIWFLNYFIKIVYKPFINVGGGVYIIDKIWVEYSNRIMVKIVFISYRKFGFRGYKIYIFIYIFIYVIVLLYFLVYLNSLKIKYDSEVIMIIWGIFLNIRIYKYFNIIITLKL